MALVTRLSASLMKFSLFVLEPDFFVAIYPPYLLQIVTIFATYMQVASPKYGGILIGLGETLEEHFSVVPEVRGFVRNAH